MRKLKLALYGFLAVIVLFFAVGFLLPSQWRVERSIHVSAQPAAIYPLIANLKTGWPQWSAFDTEDPDIKYTYSGPDEGPGAHRAWVSKRMGDGWMKIVKADPVTGIEYELQMEPNGFKLNGIVAVAPAGQGVTVTWTDYGDVGRNPLYRYMAAMMDKMMGGTFEKSLQALKLKAEGAKGS